MLVTINVYTPPLDHGGGPCDDGNYGTHSGAVSEACGRCRQRLEGNTKRTMDVSMNHIHTSQKIWHERSNHGLCQL